MQRKLSRQCPDPVTKRTSSAVPLLTTFASVADQSAQQAQAAVYTQATTEVLQTF
jgi:hypothetical protein